MFIIANGFLELRFVNDCALYEDCLGNKEEGAGNDRSVWSGSPGLHARNNGRDNGMQLRKEKRSLETLP